MSDLSSGDAIACIGMALQNPDTDEWPQLLRDCMHVIERMEDELLEAKRQRNDESRLRQAAESAAQEYTLRGWISPNPGCSELSDYDGGGWEAVYSRPGKGGAELRELLLEVTGALFRWSCEMKEDGTVDWPEPEPSEAPPFIRDVGRKVEEALDVSWKKEGFTHWRPLPAPTLCPHGMPLAENVCGPCSEGRPNRDAVNGTGD